MPSIADAFGPLAVRASMDRQLVPGCVIRINVRFPQGAKPKFLVLVASNSDALFFIVNSETNKYVASRPRIEQMPGDHRLKRSYLLGSRFDGRVSRGLA